MSFEPVISEFTDDSPCPRVEVLFTSFLPGTVRVTVVRIAEGRDFLVRGAVNAATAGALTRIDYEIPFGTPVTYRAEMFDSSGESLGYTGGTTVQLDVAETWMHNPLAPQQATPVTLLNTSARTVSRPVPGSISRPLGRRVGVVLSEPRMGLQGLALDVFASSADVADKVQSIAGSYTADTVPIACVRLGADVRLRLPRPLFLSVLDLVEEDISVRLGRDELLERMRGDEVSPPLPGVFIPLLTRADLNMYYGTRAALNSDNLTRLDVNRRYDLAGVAS